MSNLDFKEKFSVISKRQNILSILAVFSIFGMVSLNYFSDETLSVQEKNNIGQLLILGAGVSIVGAILNWRCPACKKFLGNRKQLTASKSCRSCGKTLL